MPVDDAAVVMPIPWHPVAHAKNGPLCDWNAAMRSAQLMLGSLTQSARHWPVDVLQSRNMPHCPAGSPHDSAFVHAPEQPIDAPPAPVVVPTVTPVVTAPFVVDPLVEPTVALPLPLVAPVALVAPPAPPVGTTTSLPQPNVAAPNNTEKIATPRMESLRPGS